MKIYGLALIDRNLFDKVAKSILRDALLSIKNGFGAKIIVYIVSDEDITKKQYERFLFSLSVLLAMRLVQNTNAFC